jgi:hypothetical protein
VGGYYASQADFDAAVRQQVRMQLQRDQYYNGQVRTAVQQRNRGWLYTVVRQVVGFVFTSVAGSYVGDLVTQGVDVVWDYFSDLFSW